jgi:hypothetical protein
MTKTGLEFGNSVIVICLIFVICYLEFLILLNSSQCFVLRHFSFMFFLVLVTVTHPSVFNGILKNG